MDDLQLLWLAAAAEVERIMNPSGSDAWCGGDCRLVLVICLYRQSSFRNLVSSHFCSPRRVRLKFESSAEFDRNLFG